MEKGMRSADPRDLLRIAAAQKNKEKDYWLNQLSGDPVKSIFPFDSKVRVSRDQDRCFDSVTFTLQGQVFSRLMELSKGSDARLYIILAAGLKVLLKRYSGNNDIITGAPVIKRQHPDTRLINTALAFRDQLPDHITFRELLVRVKQTIIQDISRITGPGETDHYPGNGKSKLSPGNFTGRPGYGYQITGRGIPPI
jgi:hypothetical protein